MENNKITNQISPERTREFTTTLNKEVFSLVSKAPVEDLSLDCITESEKYRVEARAVTEKCKDEIKDFSTQLAELSVLNALVVLKRDGAYYIVSGKRRLEAARRAGLATVPCRVIDYSKLKIADESFSEELKDSLLSEVMMNIIYSESEHNKPLDDLSVLSFFRQIRKNQGGQDSNSFNPIMKIIGLSRDKSIYRDTKRIWELACVDSLCKLVTEKMIPMGCAKNDLTIEVFKDPEKAKQVEDLLRVYEKDLKKNSKDEETNANLIEMKEFEKSRVMDIIHDVDKKGQSDVGKETDDYKEPSNIVNVEGDHINLSVAKIDFRDFKSKNIRKIVHTYYSLLEVTNQLKGFIDSIKPESIGKPVSQRATLKPIPIKFGKDYFDFITSKNLHLYSHISKINEYFERVLNKQLATISEIEDLKGPEKQKRLIDRFVEFSKKEEHRKELEKDQSVAQSDQKVVANSAMSKEL